jgi:hypothetical protein
MALNRSWSVILVVLAGAVLVGCEEPPRSEPPKAFRFERAQHLLLCWLNEPDNSARRQEIITAADRLRTLSGVADVSAGRSIPDLDNRVDDSFDVAVLVTLDQQAGLKKLTGDPLYRTFVEQTLHPMSRRVVVYNFVDYE